MTGWLLVAVWLVGWLLAVRPAMRRTMLMVVCSDCRAPSGCTCSGRPWDAATRVVRGSAFERTGGDVAWSVWIAAWWPVWLAFVVLRKTAAAVGAGVKTAVIRATPLTEPELERRIAEQQEEIARLTEEIGGSS